MRADNVRSEVFDARAQDPSMKRKADVVVADLPCSGIGVIGKKPEIRYRLQEEDLPKLCALQRQILSVVQEYAADHAFLSYSTCTINKKENEETARWFTERYPFTLLEEKSFLPGKDRCDGAYVALFRRKT